MPIKKSPDRIKRERALAHHYLGEVERIRQQYVSALEALDLSDAERANKAKARALESDYRVLSRKFRSDVSILKKKGILRKATKPSPLSRSVRETLDTFHSVITGKRKTTRVSKQAAKRLRETQHIVRNNVIMHDEIFSYDKKTGELKRKGNMHIVETIHLNENVEEQVNEVFRRMKGYQYLSFDVYGNQSHVLFSPDELGQEEFRRAMENYKIKLHAGTNDALTVSVIYFGTDKKEAFKSWLAKGKISKERQKKERNERERRRRSIQRQREKEAGIQPRRLRKRRKQALR